MPGAPPPAEGQGGAGGRIAYLLGPDDVKLEIVTNREPNAPPLEGHHMHFINKQYVEMRASGTMKAFDAPCGRSKTDFFIGGDLPGVGYSLNFFRWEGDQSVTHVPTRGRVTDRVGFEVKNLEAFCKALEAKGIKLTAPYRKEPGLNNIGTRDDHRSMGRLDRAHRGIGQGVVAGHLRACRLTARSRGHDESNARHDRPVTLLLVAPALTRVRAAAARLGRPDRRRPPSLEHDEHGRAAGSSGPTRSAGRLSRSGPTTWRSSGSPVR